MASTYSSLKIELIGTGEQAGTWGNTTNTNLGTAIEEAIVESADVAFSSADVTLTLTNTNATQIARHLRLNLTGTSGGARNLILGSGCQIEKPYLINNGLADTVTVKNTSGTGIAVPSGKTMWVYNDGTNVVDAVTHLSSLSLSTALPITSGGTGSTSTTFVDLTTNVTGTLPAANGGTGITSLGTGVATWLETPSSANLAAAVTDETGSGALVFATSPTLTTPDLGTPSALTLTNATSLPLSTGVTGQLPLANGGTGANLTDPNADRILFWDDSAGAMTFLTVSTGLSISGTTLTATGGTGTVTSVSGTGTVNGITLTGTVTSSGSLTLGGTLSGVSLTTQVSGTLPVGNGGTGATTLTGVIKGNGTSAFSAATAGTDYVAPGTATTFTAQQTFKGLKDTVFTITDGAGFDIDPDNGAIQIITLGANRTPVATNFEAGQVMLLGIDDGSAYSITWTSVNPTWVKAGGSASAPTLGTSGYTWILFWKVASTIYGTEVGQP